MTNYNGSDLAAYANREKTDARAQKPGESDEAYTRRVNFWYASSDAVTEQDDWAQHREQVARTASGRGLYDRATPQERAAALGSPGAAFSGSQIVIPQGHLVRENNPNQPAPARIYRSETHEPDAVSPLVRALRGDTAPSPTHERWS